MSGLALGVDIGGSRLKLAPVDLSAGVIVGGLREEPTTQGASPEELATVIAEFAADVEGDDAVGCAFPGRIRAGVALTAINLHEAWIGARPGAVLEPA